MARLNDLHPDLVANIMALELPQLGETPWAPAPRRQEARVAMLSTAALHRRDDPPFRRGATDFRVIPATVDESDLVMSHVSANFDRSGFQADLNVVFPLGLLHRLAERGEIGSVAAWHYSVLGSVDPMLLRDTAGEIARLLRDDEVDSVLLVPV